MNITAFDIWVNDNNPDPELSYGKGWWDFVEMVRRIAWKLQIEDVSTAATFILKTPPPQEELLSPIVCMRTEWFAANLKWDFGRIWEEWTVSVEPFQEREVAGIPLFLGNEEVDEKALVGFSPEWSFPRFEDSRRAFTARLVDELDVYGLLRLLTPGTIRSRPPWD